MERIRCRKARHGVYIRAFERSPVRNIVLRSWQIGEAPGGNVIQHVERLTMDNVLIQGKPASL